MSNNSADFLSSSHEDQEDGCEAAHVSTISHQRGFGEAAARGAKTPFIPISEDTVFLESEPSLPATVVLNTSNTSSSPHSMDSWLNYDSTSSEEYSYADQIMPNLSRPDDADDSYDEKRLGQKSAKVNKRNCDHVSISDVPDADDDEDDDERVDEELEQVNSINAASKRVKAQDQRNGGMSSSSSRRSSVHRRGSAYLTDVRMIDFAHTTFAVQNGGFSMGRPNQKVSYTSTTLSMLTFIKIIYFCYFLS